MTGADNPSRWRISYRARCSSRDNGTQLVSQRSVFLNPSFPAPYIPFQTLLSSIFLTHPRLFLHFLHVSQSFFTHSCPFYSILDFSSLILDSSILFPDSSSSFLPFPWTFLEVLGSSWTFCDIPWHSITFYNIPKHSMAFHDLPWPSRMASSMMSSPSRSFRRVLYIT